MENPMKLPAILLALLAATLAAPTALAADDLDVGDEFVLPCGAILAVGVVPYAVCWVYVAGAAGESLACTAWRIIWGPGAACPTV